MSQIAILIGSLRKDSINRKLARAVARLAPPHLSFTWPRIDDLPLYNQDDDANQHSHVIRLKREIAAAQGMIFVTPEYNGTFDERGEIAPADTKRFLQGRMDRYVNWIGRHSSSSSSAA
jgi:hypothetical protein